MPQHTAWGRVYATHLPKAGVALRLIQSALVHESLKTTEIYTHIMDVNK